MYSAHDTGRAVRMVVNAELATRSIKGALFYPGVGLLLTVSTGLWKAYPVIVGALWLEPGLACVLVLCGGLFVAYRVLDARQNSRRFVALVRVREELRNTVERAQAADHAKTTFLATMSHEMRTPMHVCIGTCQLLQTTTLDGEQLQLARTISEASETMLALINDILDLSRIESGALVLHESDYYPDRVLRSLCAMFVPLAQQKGLSLEFDLDSLGEVALRGDRGKIQQLLMNLIANAVKFTQEGEVSIGASVQPTEGGLALSVVIEDTGPGMSKHDMERVYQPFVRLSNARDVPGSGLGLAITKALCAAMGGTLHVHSRLGEGTSFEVVLPQAAAVQAPRPDSLVVPHQEEKSPLRPTGRRVRALVVDDTSAARDLAVGMLQALGLEAEAVPDGHEALKRCAQGDLDIVLMDCRMPDMDGLEVTRAVRALAGEAAQVPIVAVTANAFDADREAARAAGMNGFLGKPFRLQELRVVLSRHVDLSPPLAANDVQPQAQASESLYPTASANLRDTLGPYWTRESAERVIVSFLEGWEGHREQLQEALQQQDFRVMRDVAHALAGSVRLGLAGVDGAIERLQKAAREDDLQAVRTACEALTEAIQGLRESHARHAGPPRVARV